LRSLRRSHAPSLQQQLDRRAQHRLAILRHAEEVTGNVKQFSVARLLDLPTNLVAHHLGVLDAAGPVTRTSVPAFVAAHSPARSSASSCFSPATRTPVAPPAT
jgi:hypothetical protein